MYHDVLPFGVQSLPKTMRQVNVYRDGGGATIALDGALKQLISGRIAEFDLAFPVVGIPKNPNHNHRQYRTPSSIDTNRYAVSIDESIRQ